MNMKTALILIGFVSSVFLSAQKDFVVSAPRHQYLIIDFTNPLEIMHKNIPSENLILTTDNGEIEKNETVFLIKPIKTGIANFTLYKKGSEQAIDSFRMVVKHIFKPELTYRGKAFGTYPKTIFKEGNKICTAHLPEEYHICLDNISIESLSLLVLDTEGKSVYSAIQIPNSVSAELVKAAEQFQSGYTVLIFDVIFTEKHFSNPNAMMKFTIQ